MLDPFAARRLDEDFARARRKAFVHDVLAAVGGRPNDLIPYHEVRRRVAPERESYRGHQTVPIAKIVGSMDRFNDFDREFLPRQRFTAGRWQNVDRAYYQDRQLPPIQLYRVGDVYFVKDGNHRVSVARERGQEFIDAEVIEGHVRAPLYASMRPDELLLQAEYAEFLRRTDLDRLRPDHDVRPTALGRYDEIWRHIEGHRRWLEEEFERRPVGVREAVDRWYDRVYLPIVRAARERGVMEHFPGRTETDVYLWAMNRRDELYDRYRRAGEPFGPAAAHVEAMDARLGPRARSAAALGRVRRPVAGLGGRIRGRGAPAPASPAA
jgi:hypothetical protein